MGAEEEEKEVKEELRSREAATSEDKKSRNLKEAIAFYGDSTNRLIGWSQKERVYLRKTLDESIMRRLGYDIHGLQVYDEL